MIRVVHRINHHASMDISPPLVCPIPTTTAIIPFNWRSPTPSFHIHPVIRLPHMV